MARILKDANRDRCDSFRHDSGVFARLPARRSAKPLASGTGNRLLHQRRDAAFSAQQNQTAVARFRVGDVVDLRRRSGDIRDHVVLRARGTCRFAVVGENR